MTAVSVSRLTIRTLSCVIEQGTFENRASWWDPTAAAAQNAALSHLSKLGHQAHAGGDVDVPFMDADFRTASFSLSMSQGSSDMHLAFHSREAKVRRNNV